MIAETIQQGIPRICVQSSGNTATSVLKYAKKTGLEVVLFYLNSNNYKLDPSLVPENVFLIEVVGTEKQLKANLAKFSELSQVPVRP